MLIQKIKIYDILENEFDYKLYIQDNDEFVLLSKFEDYFEFLINYTTTLNFKICYNYKNNNKTEEMIEEFIIFDDNCEYMSDISIELSYSLTRNCFDLFKIYK